MEIYSGADLLERRVCSFNEGGITVGLVPTMGALHMGHISLLDCCKRDNDVSIVSIFVNPTQFNDPEDLKKYPRNLEKDIDLLNQCGCDIVFCPTEKEIYPEPDTRIFDLGKIGEVMEGMYRPGHFNGVVQVVTRLFDIVKPRKAYFGIKDFQQVAVIKKVTYDLNYNIDIVECPVVREEDGLAMSSRNLLLDPRQRAAAAAIPAALFRAKALFRGKSVQWIKDYVKDTVDSKAGLKTEYFEIVDEETLQSADDFSKPAVGCIAVKVGKVRLIDNVYFS